MKKNNKKIIVGIILSISIIGIGTIIYLDKTSTPELEIVVDESVLETESTEAIAPEEEIEEVEEVVEVVENTEEKPKRKVINVHDAQKFLESQEKTNVVNTSTKSDNNEAITPIPETPVPATPTPEPEVTKEVTPEYIDYSEKYEGAYGYVPSEDGNTFSTVPVKCNDLSSNPTLLALQAEVNPIFDADGAISEAFVLTKNGAAVAYAGTYYGSDCEVIVSEKGFTTVAISCNLNDTSWRCLSTVMNELYDNGAAMIEEVKKACYSSSTIYSLDKEDTWVEFLGIHTKVVFDSNNYTLYFYFK